MGCFCKASQAVTGFGAGATVGAETGGADGAGVDSGVGTGSVTGVGEGVADGTSTTSGGGVCSRLAKARNALHSAFTPEEKPIGPCSYNATKRKVKTANRASLRAKASKVIMREIRD